MKNKILFWMEDIVKIAGTIKLSVPESCHSSKVKFNLLSTIDLKQDWDKSQF